MSLTITPMRGFGRRIDSLNVHSLTAAERARLNEALAQLAVFVAQGCHVDHEAQVRAWFAID